VSPIQVTRSSRWPSRSSSKSSPAPLEIISDESKLTRGSQARLTDGTACACLEPRAVRFCAVGALNRAAGELLADNGFYHATEAERTAWSPEHQRHRRTRGRDRDVQGRTRPAVGPLVVNFATAGLHKRKIIPQVKRRG
jgi:hypothetical protein